MIKKIINKIFGKETTIGCRCSSSLPITELIDLDYQNFKIVFDIGAYHGSFTEAISKKNTSTQVHVFEPNNLAFEVLNNRFQNKNIFLNNCAVGELQEERILHLNQFEETNSLLLSNSVDLALDKLTKKISEQKVSVITVDKYCDKLDIKQIDFIKIDAQGNSYNILLGASNLLKNQRIKFLYIETEFIQIYKDEKCFSEIELFLRNVGYQLVNFYNLNYSQDNRVAWCDSLFTIKN